MQGITRRSFLGGSSALAAGTYPLSGFASDLIQEQLLLVGTQTAEPSTSKGVSVYRFNAETGELTQLGPAVEAENPTFLVLGPRERFVYAVNEVRRGTVSSFSFDKKSVRCRRLVRSPPKAEGQRMSSDIAFDRKMNFAYVASRLDDFVATFAVSPLDGKLTMIGKTSCGGKRPRHLALDPTDRWLLIANQDTDTIAVFARDDKSGKLANEGKTFPLSRPQRLVFV